MENKVLAVVDGREVKQSDLQSLMQNLGQNAAQFAGEEGLQHLLNEIIAQELLYSDAVASKLDAEEAFLTVLEQMKKSLLIQYAANQLMTSVTASDQEVKAFFDANPDAFKPEQTAEACHILVENKDLADQISTEIKEGLSFADAAMKYSTCPSKENGGALGEFSRGRMVPEFEDAAFKMTVGEISEPVQTQFGYHIIKLDAISDSRNVAFEEVRDQVTQQCVLAKQNEAYAKKQDELKGKYDVKIVE